MNLAFRFLHYAAVAAACSRCSSANAPAAPCADGGRCSDANPPTNPLCPDAGRCITFSPDTAESEIAAAFATVQKGDTIVFVPGTYSFTNLLDLGTADNVSILGSGPDQTILDFHGQKAGEEALFAQSVSNLRFEGFAILDTPGNGIKTLGVNGITFRSLKVTWTPMDKTDWPIWSLSGAVQQRTHRALHSQRRFGLRPLCRPIAGYRRSQQRGVRQRRRYRDRELFSCRRARQSSARQYRGNPGLRSARPPTRRGALDPRSIRIRLPPTTKGNFAAMGDIVGLVPAGTGFFVMANHDVEIFRTRSPETRRAAQGSSAMPSRRCPLPTRTTCSIRPEFTFMTTCTPGEAPCPI